MKIAIFGAKGFIGGWLVESLPAHDYEVLVCPEFRYDLMQPNSMEFVPVIRDFLELHKPDIIVNSLGSASVPYSFENPTYDFSSNLIVPQIILEQMRTSVPRAHYVHISSAAIYGNGLSLPISEDVVACPLSPYGWSKYLSEELARSYFELYGIPVIVLRPFSVYGPRLKKQIFWDISKKVTYLSNEKCLTLKGSGEESRDYMYITDMCDAVAMIIKNRTENFNIFNLANGSETSIKDAATVLLTSFGKDNLITFENLDMRGAPKRWRANVEKIQSFGYKPKVSLSEGLKRYVEWYKEYNGID